MNRRALLAGMTLLVAGCTARGEPTLGDERDAGDESGAWDEPGAGGESNAGNDERVAVGSSESTATDVVNPKETVSPGVDVDLVELNPETEAGTAVVAFEADAVHVDGTVIGETGCHAVSVTSATLAEDGTFRLEVAAIDDAAPDELCTLALTEIGYEIDLTFADGLPEEVAVVHDDAMGHETVVVETGDDA